MTRWPTKDREWAAVLAVAVIGAIVGLAVGSPLVAVGSGPAGAVVVHVRATLGARRRRRRLADETVAVVDDLVTRLKAGHSLPRAVRAVLVPSGPDGESVVMARLAPVAAGLGAGEALGPALRRAGRRLVQPAEPPVAMVIGGLALLVERGGPAVPALERLADTLRSAQAVEGEVRAQAAQATASATALAVLPGLFAVGAASLDRGLARFYLGEWAGAGCVGVAGALSWAGWWWMQRLIEPDR